MPKFTSVKNTDYSFEVFERALTPFELKTFGEIAVWWDYIRQRSSPTTNTALRELLFRHENMLTYLAQTNHKKFPNNSDWEDKLQHARLGAMRSYERFDINAGVRLSTFVQASVFRYLQSSNDSDAFIDCPPFARKIRSYLSGKYDAQPLKKFEVEKSLGINTAEDRAVLLEKFHGVIIKYSSLDVPVVYDGDKLNASDVIPGAYISDVEIIGGIHLDMKMCSLSERQRYILEQFSNGAKMSSIARSLKISEGTVRGEIAAARKIMRRELSESAT